MHKVFIDDLAVFVDNNHDRKKEFLEDKGVL